MKKEKKNSELFITITRQNKLWGLYNMGMDEKYLKDYEEIISHRYDNGWDYFTTKDLRQMIIRL